MKKKLKIKQLKREVAEWEFSAEYWRDRCFTAEQVLIDHNTYWDTPTMDDAICNRAIDEHLGALVDLIGYTAEENKNE